jgi:hypothetical protein
VHGSNVLGLDIVRIYAIASTWRAARVHTREVQVEKIPGRKDEMTGRPKRIVQLPPSRKHGKVKVEERNRGGIKTRRVDCSDRARSNSPGRERWMIVKSFEEDGCTGCEPIGRDRDQLPSKQDLRYRASKSLSKCSMTTNDRNLPKSKVNGSRVKMSRY